MLPRLTFIETLPQNATTRERELQISEARKHAASIAYLRRRGVLPNFRRVSQGTPTKQKLRPILSAASAPSRLKRASSQLQRDDGADVANYDRALSLDKDLQQENSKDEWDKQVKAVSKLIQALWKRDLSKLVVSSYHMDPFYRIPHGHSVSFYEAVDFFTHTILPNNAPVYTIFNVSNIYSTYTFDLASKDHFLHIWIATMHLIRSMAAPQSTSSQTALRHQGAALVELQRVVSLAAIQPDDYTICSVLFVALLARAYGNQQSHATHCHFLQQMVQQRGGLDELGFDGITKCAILQWESFWALHTGESMFQGLRHSKPPIYPSVPLSTEMQAQVWKLPVGFQRLAYQGKLAIDVLELLERISNVLNDHDALKRISPVDAGQWSMSKYADFWEACRCLAEPQPSLQKFLCLALLLFCANEYSPKRSFRRGMTIFGGPRALLTSELPKLAVNDVAETECLMWIWMVVVDAWSSDCAEDGNLPPTGQSFLFDFRKAFPDITSWEAVMSILRRFFWPKRFSSACKAFWARGAG